MPPTDLSGYPRKLTKNEESEIKKGFPEIDVNSVWATAPRDDQYNCVAYALGFTDRWIDPPPAMAAFESLFQGYGFTPTSWQSSDAVTDGWGLTVNQMTHSSVAYSGPPVGSNGLWESKLGNYIRLAHGQLALQGSLFGTVLDGFRPGTVQSTVLPLRHPDAFGGHGGGQMQPFSDLEIRLLQESASGIDSDTRERFFMLFSRWRQTWFEGAMKFSSSTADRAKGEEFHDLVAMGPQIIPLILEQLVDPKNFIALRLLDQFGYSGEATASAALELGQRSRVLSEQEKALMIVRSALAKKP